MAAVSEATQGPARMRRGMIWFSAGSALLIGTYALSTFTVNRILAYILLGTGLYLLVLGIEKMVGGYFAGLRSGDPEAIRSIRRAGAACLVVGAITGAAGWSTYVARSPYWKSIESLSAGHEKGVRLIEIIERHTESLEAGLAAPEELERWMGSARATLELRSALADALEAARYLAEHGEGDLRVQAESLEPFYSACMEWIRFYESIERSFEDETMTEPKAEWAEEHDRLHQKIHDAQPGHADS